MTLETKYYADFNDIIGLELTCPACGTAVAHTLAKFSSAAYQCPNCRSQIIAQSQTDDETLSNFVNFLKLVQTLKTPARLRLQLKPLVSQTSAGQQ